MSQAILEEMTPEALSQRLEKGEVFILQPKGVSMLPFIRQGVDKVELGRPDRLEVGNIVLAFFGGKYLLHRIYAIDGEKVTLKGDGNLRGIEQGTKADVIGVVTGIINPKGKVRKPGKAWLWRHTRRYRKYELKIYRKWMKLKTILI